MTAPAHVPGAVTGRDLLRTWGLILVFFAGLYAWALVHPPRKQFIGPPSPPMTIAALNATIQHGCDLRHAVWVSFLAEHPNPILEPLLHEPCPLVHDPMTREETAQGVLTAPPRSRVP
jgi:hypothetical protein